MSQRIVEERALHVREADGDAAPGRLLVQLITPGWGSSGYYSRPVLENAAAEKVWPAGTHVYFDHPSETERTDRPERSVRDLAAILEEDAYADDAGGLVATANIIGPYRELLTDETFMAAVCMSIRASADTTVGEAEGRRGTIVTRLIEGESVDVVTRAGRGGRILAAVESARATLAAEATTEDTRERLDRAVRADHGDEDQWAYVMDFDADAGLVWFTNDTGMYEQGYELTTNGATLTGDPVEVRRVVTYPRLTDSTTPTGGGGSATESTPTPVTPAGTTTHASQEDTMSTTPIEETRLRQLEEDAGRVPALEAERDTATSRAISESNRADALTLLMESGHTFGKLERKGILADLPTLEDGTLDAEKFKAALDESAADRLPVEGGVSGFGSTTPGGTTNVNESGAPTWDDIDSHLGLKTQEA